MASGASSLPPPATASLSKLQTQGLPRLKGNAPKPIDTALWLRSLVRWANLNGLAGYLEGPLPSTVDPNTSNECIRYLSAAIESDSLRGILADQTHTNSRAAFKFIRERWLNGVSESTIFRQRMSSAVFSDDRGIQSFAADFNLWHRHIEPVMHVEEAVECFDTSLPAKWEIFCASARQSPGIDSVRTGTGKSDPPDHLKSFMAYTDKVVELVMRYESRCEARAMKQGTGTSTFDSLPTHLNGHQSCMSSPHADALLNHDTSIDLQEKLQRTLVEVGALATQIRNQPPPSRSGNTQPAPTSRTPAKQMTSGNTPATLNNNIQCFCCGAYGHIMSQCPMDPKPVCDHGLCKLRGRVTHIRALCPFYNPDSLTNIRLRQRCQHEAEIWKQAQLEERKKSSQASTPALQTTKCDEQNEEAQQLYLEDLLDDTDLEYDALPTFISPSGGEDSNTMSTSSLFCDNVEDEIGSLSPSTAVQTLVELLNNNSDPDDCLIQALSKTLPPEYLFLLPPTNIDRSSQSIKVPGTLTSAPEEHEAMSVSVQPIGEQNGASLTPLDYLLSCPPRVLLSLITNSCGQVAQSEKKQKSFREHIISNILELILSSPSFGVASTDRVHKALASTKMHPSKLSPLITASLVSSFFEESSSAGDIIKHACMTYNNENCKHNLPTPDKNRYYHDQATLASIHKHLGIPKNISDHICHTLCTGLDFTDPSAVRKFFLEECATPPGYAKFALDSHRVFVKKSQLGGRRQSDTVCDTPEGPHIQLRRINSEEKENTSQNPHGTITMPHDTADHSETPLSQQTSSWDNFGGFGNPGSPIPTHILNHPACDTWTPLRPSLFSPLPTSPLADPDLSLCPSSPTPGAAAYDLVAENLVSEEHPSFGKVKWVHPRDSPSAKLVKHIYGRNDPSGSIPPTGATPVPEHLLCDDLLNLIEDPPDPLTHSSLVPPAQEIQAWQAHLEAWEIVSPQTLPSQCELTKTLGFDSTLREWYEHPQSEAPKKTDGEPPPIPRPATPRQLSTDLTPLPPHQVNASAKKEETKQDAPGCRPDCTTSCTRLPHADHQYQPEHDKASLSKPEKMSKPPPKPNAALDYYARRARRNWARSAGHHKWRHAAMCHAFRTLRTFAVTKHSATKIVCVLPQRQAEYKPTSSLPIGLFTPLDMHLAMRGLGPLSFQTFESESPPDIHSPPAKVLPDPVITPFNRGLCIEPSHYEINYSHDDTYIDKNTSFTKTSSKIGGRRQIFSNLTIEMGPTIAHAIKEKFDLSKKSVHPSHFIIPALVTEIEDLGPQPPYNYGGDSEEAHTLELYLHHMSIYHKRSAAATTIQRFYRLLFPKHTRIPCHRGTPNLSEDIIHSARLSALVGIYTITGRCQHRAKILSAISHKCWLGTLISACLKIQSSYRKHYYHNKIMALQSSHTKTRRDAWTRAMAQELQNTFHHRAFTAVTKDMPPLTKETIAKTPKWFRAGDRLTASDHQANIYFTRSGSPLTRQSNTQNKGIPTIRPSKPLDDHTHKARRDHTQNTGPHQYREACVTSFAPRTPRNSRRNNTSPTNPQFLKAVRPKTERPPIPLLRLPHQYADPNMCFRSQCEMGCNCKPEDSIYKTPFMSLQQTKYLAQGHPHAPYAPAPYYNKCLRNLAFRLGLKRIRRSTLKCIHAVLVHETRPDIYPTHASAQKIFGCTSTSYFNNLKLIRQLEGTDNWTDALPITVIEDNPQSPTPKHEALITHPMPSGSETPIMCYVDSGCMIDIEDERGSKGFFGPAESCRVTLVTGTDEHTRPHFRCAHRHYLIDTNGRIIEDTRTGVYSTASTPFKRCLFSPNTAAARGIITVIIPPELGSSYLQFPNKQRVALINTGKAYLLPRYFTREAAEKAINTQQQDPLPPMTLIPVMNISAEDNTEDTSVATLWHRRLGHRSINILQQLHEHCLHAPVIKSLKPITRAHLDACSICPAARLKRKPQPKIDPTHPHLSPASVKAFGHCIARDHFGPLTPSFYHKYTMGQILVDLHTSDIWFYGQKDKTAEESLQVIKRFEADTAPHGPILRYHSDGAKEFTGSLMTDYCLNKNPPTKITFTTTAASNSNAIAENGVFRLLSIARALLVDSGIPNEHWPAACAHASEIIHVTPRLYPKHSTNEGSLVSTPYFMRTGQQPSPLNICTSSAASFGSCSIKPKSIKREYYIRQTNALSLTDNDAVAKMAMDAAAVKRALHIMRRLA